MAIIILLNFSIAIVWMFLNSSFTAHTFMIGYIIALLTMFIMRRYFKEKFYLSRVWTVVKLGLIFIKELTLSNIAVLRIVLQPKMDIEPSIFAFPTDLQHNWEITLLSNLITLTRSEEHTSELQSRGHLVCRLLLEKKINQT